MTRAYLFAALCAVGCGCASAPPATAKPKIASVAELAALMKNDINPAFSRVMFLLFHGESVEDDTQALRAEMQRSAALLRASVVRLRQWPKVPAESDEARSVFYTFAQNVEGNTDKLVAAIASEDEGEATRQLEQIADTCNNCHHFFRLNIEDSKVGPKQAAAVVLDSKGSQ